ncbi:sigma-70 family RNA polymerase sigma factor [Kitasatospora sp. NPDC098652]|uniref:sigma-70 family RNA polymerase sigma factor n=1 Tax=Kitasatospora sp. NPDC098652 TaxID=3364095 RepID=UPI0037F50307
MTTFTPGQISAAQNGDLSAISAIISEAETLIQQRAREYAISESWADYALADDLASVGRVRLWEVLQTFEGDNPRKFMHYVDQALHSAMSEERRKHRRPGVSERTARDFELAITLAAGDPFAAVQIATTDEMGPRKMTRDRAYAALLSWLGTESIDPHRSADAEDDSGDALRDVVAVLAEVPADLVEAADYDTTRRNAIREQVQRTLSLLSERQRHVLKADHGIAPVGLYGDQPDAVLADAMGVTPYQVKQARIKGKTRFAELYAAGAQTW